MKMLIIAICALMLAGCPPHDDAHPRTESEPVATTEQALVWESDADFIDNAPIGVHRVLSDGTIAYANAMDYEPLGYTETQWVDHLIQEFHVDQPVIDDIFVRLLAGETLHNYPARLRAFDGHVVYVSIQSRSYFDGGVHQHTRCFTSIVSKCVYDRLKIEM